MEEDWIQKGEGRKNGWSEETGICVVGVCGSSFWPMAKRACTWTHVYLDTRDRRKQAALNLEALYRARERGAAKKKGGGKGRKEQRGEGGLTHGCWPFDSLPFFRLENFFFFLVALFALHGCAAGLNIAVLVAKMEVCKSLSSAGLLAKNCGLCEFSLFGEEQA